MPGWTRGVCRANGVDVHYLRTGGGKPPLVALHGLTGSGACWTPVARALEPDWDIVMPDARGHGQSSAPERSYSYEDHMRDVTGLIEGLGLGTPALMGHSMGGLTAALAASREVQDIPAVVLADPTFLSLERQCDVYVSDAVAQHRRFLAMTREDALAYARRRHPHRSPEVVKLVTDARLRTPVRAFEVLTPPNPDYREIVAAIRVPILLVFGDGGVVSTSMARDLQGLNERVQYKTMVNAGHGLHYDQPDRFVAVVGDYLRSTVTP